MASSPATPAAVIFDNDGVLVDSEPLAGAVLAGLLTENGLPTTEEEVIRRYLGSTLAGVRASVRTQTGRPLPDDFEDTYHRRLYRAFQRLRPVPGVVAALEELARAGTPVAVASNGTHDRVDRALQRTGLARYFPERLRVGADDVARGKPAPDLFAEAAGRLRVRPADCVVVEDSPQGVAAARAAGMRVLGYAAHTPADRLADADIVFADMRQLPDLLRG